jgi:hypothetical protein
MFVGESLENAYKQVVPESSLGYHSNNQYDNFPPLMSDGRAVVASWQPEAVTNNQMIKENGISSNWQYRKYLTQNANRIMKTNFDEASNDIGYVKRDYEPNQPSNPFLYKSFLDNSRPFGYETSDLKETYLSREQLNARKVAPAITQEHLLASQQRHEKK